MEENRKPDTKEVSPGGGKSFLATLVQSAITYKISKTISKSSLLKNTAIGRSSSLATAVSLGVGFLFSAMKEDSSLVNTALAITTIGATVSSKGKILDVLDKYYKNVDEINKNVQKLKNLNYRFQEWGVESRQLYRERKTDETRIDVLKKNINNFVSYVAKNDKFNRSQAYSIVKNNSEGLIDSEFLTARQYRKLSNLPAHLQDYVDDYTSVNLKIGKSSFAATDGVGYFSHYDDDMFKAFDNVDASKVFAEGLNRDFEFYKAQASTHVTNNPHLNKDKTGSNFDIYKKHIISSFKNKESEFVENGFSSDEAYIKTKEFFSSGDDPIMKALMNSQASSENLSYSTYLKKYENAILEEVKSFNNDYVGNKSLESLLEDESFLKLKDKMGKFRKGNNNLFFKDEYARDNDSELLRKLVIKNSVEPNEPLNLFENFGSDKYDFFGNMKVHDKILYKETNSGLRAIDRTITSYDSIEKGILSSIESNLTPYFKALPFLPDSFRRFNAFASFKIKDSIISNLDVTTIKTFKEANYNVKDSLVRVKDTISSINFIKSKALDLENFFDLNKTIKEYNFNIKNNFSDVRDEFGVNSNVKFEKRTLNFLEEYSQNPAYKDRINVIREINKVEKEAYNEYSKLLEMDFNGYKGFDVYSSEKAATSYHSYSLDFGKGIEFRKSLHNSNNVIVVDNTSYYREFEFKGSKNNGHFDYSYKKGDENVVYSTNAFIKEVQSQRLGSAITNNSSKGGVYVDEKETTEYFSLNKFLNSDNKIKYWNESDISLNPFSKRVSVNDEANVLSIYKKRYEEMAALIKFSKETGKTLEADDALLYTLGKNSKSRLSSELEKHEINDVFKRIFETDEFIFPEKLTADELLKLPNKEIPFIKDFKNEVEFINSVRSLDISDDVLTKHFGSETSNFLKHFDVNNISENTSSAKSRLYSHSVISNLQNINRTLKNVETPSELAEFSETFKNLDLDFRTNKKDAFLSYVDESTFLKDSQKSISELDTVTQLNEIERVSKKNAITKVFKLSDSYENFESIVGKEALDGNVYVNLDRLRHIDRVDYVADREATLVKKSFTNLDLKKDGVIKSAFKIFKEFNDETAFSNEASFKVYEAVEAVENVFNTIGIKKLNFESKVTSSKYVEDFLKRRVYNIALTVASIATIDAVTDVLVPDEVPFLGEGIKSAAGEVVAGIRFGMQVAINMSGLGHIFRKLEETYPGMFTDNGMLAPLDLSDTNDEMFGKLYRGDEVAVKKNRFWYTSGRTDFEGGEVETFRKHLLYSLRHRDSGVYDNKIERFVRKDFLPTSLAWYAIDPYKEERELASKGKMFPQSEQLFNDVFFVGGLLSATVGEAIKPTLYINKDKWMNENGEVLNPSYNPSDPTSKQYVKFETPNLFERVFIPAYEDTVRMAGMRGYLFDAVMKNSFIDLNTTSGKTELDRLDKHTSTSQKYEDLQLGGMFGTTEGIRRIYESNKMETTAINPVPIDNELSWLPKDYYKNYDFGAYGIGIKDSSLQGINESSDFYTRLNTLAINAPYSDEFRALKKELITNLSNGSVDDKQAYSAYKALSYANAIIGTDVSDRINIKADVENKSVSVKRVTDFGEFLGKDGIRYKLAGMNPDYDNPYSSERKANELKEFMTELNNSGNLSVVVNSNKALSVKTDEQGKYVEVYAPEFDKYETLKQAHYLRENFVGKKTGNYLLEFLSNAFKPSFMEKTFNNKDVVGRFVDDSLISPQFKDWENPIESFLMPFVRLSERGIGGFLNSMFLSNNVGSGSIAMPVINTLSFAKGLIFGESESKHYYEEDLIVNTLQKSREMSGMSNVYEMTGRENITTLKTFLSPTERKYFKDIINTSDLVAREEIYNESSARFRQVLDTAWKQQADFVNENYESFDASKKTVNYINSSHFDSSELSNDNSLATAQLRSSLLGKSFSYEKSNLYRNFGTISLFDNAQRRLIRQNNFSIGSKTMSTSFTDEVDHFEN